VKARWIRGRDLSQGAGGCNRIRHRRDVAEVQDGGFHLGPQAFAQDLSDFDGRGLQEDVGAAQASLRGG